MLCFSCILRCGESCRALLHSQSDDELRLTEEDIPGEQISGTPNHNIRAKSSFNLLDNGNVPKIVQGYINDPTTNPTRIPSFPSCLKNHMSEKQPLSTTSNLIPYTDESTVTEELSDIPDFTPISFFFSDQRWFGYDPFVPDATPNFKRYCYNHDQSLLRRRLTPQAFEGQVKRDQLFSQSFIKSNQDGTINPWRFSSRLNWSDDVKIINHEITTDYLQQCGNNSEIKQFTCTSNFRQQLNIGVNQTHPDDGDAIKCRDDKLVITGTNDIIIKNLIKRKKDYQYVDIWMIYAPDKCQQEKQSISNFDNLRVMSRHNSMPAKVRVFGQRETSFGGEVTKPGRSDPDGRGERVIERLKEEEEKMNVDDKVEKKKSEFSIPYSDEDDAIFSHPFATVIGRFNDWDHSTTKYLEKTRRTAKSVSGSIWTRSVDAYSNHRLLQSLTLVHGNLETNQTQIISIDSSIENLSVDDDDDDDDDENGDSSEFPKVRRSMTRDYVNQPLCNFPSNWAFVPRRLHSSASLWVLVGSSIRRRVFSDAPDIYADP